MNSSENSLLTYLAHSKSDPKETFQLFEKIGEGTYGNVYKALNKLTDKLVAIKICTLNSDERAYMNELNFLRNIDHPCIVKLYDAYITDDEIWLILEYCQLGSISDIIKLTRQVFTECEIACICESILQALDYLHMIHKIHRDIKPANILINSIGQVKLADFGIASAKSHSDSFIGSPLWMSPEQLAKLPYDSKVDIWALGITIIEMAEGKAPFEHLHPIRAMFAIQHNPQTKFTNPNKFSNELNDFLSHCLQINPKLRPTANQLLNHSFIQKFQGDFHKIRKSFHQNKLKAIENSKKAKALCEMYQSKEQLGNNRKKILIGLEENQNWNNNGNDNTNNNNQAIIYDSYNPLPTNSSKGYNGVLNANLDDDGDMILLSVQDKVKDLNESSIAFSEDPNYQTFIEKSSITSISCSLTNEGLNLKGKFQNQKNLIEKFNLALALKCIKENSIIPYSSLQDPLTKDLNRTFPKLISCEMPSKSKYQEPVIDSLDNGTEMNIPDDANELKDLRTSLLNMNGTTIKEKKIYNHNSLSSMSDKTIAFTQDLNITTKKKPNFQVNNNQDLTYYLPSSPNPFHKNPNKISKASKTYKQVNHGNFIVKYGRKLENSKINESFETEITSNPISIDSDRQSERDKSTYSTQEILGINGIIIEKRRAITASTQFTRSILSQKTQNGGGGGGNYGLDLYPIKKDNELIFKIIRENLDFCQYSIAHNYTPKKLEVKDTIESPTIKKIRFDTRNNNNHGNPYGNSNGNNGNGKSNNNDTPNAMQDRNLKYSLFLTNLEKSSSLPPHR